MERSQALTLQYDKVVFILEPSEQAKAAIGKGVTVVDDPPWPLSFRYKAVELAYRTFDNVRQVDHGAIADNKRLGAALAFIRDEQRRREPERRSQSAPRRRDQPTPVSPRPAELLYEPSERSIEIEMRF